MARLFCLVGILAFFGTQAETAGGQGSNKDVCIIGAGPAGLTAAHRLELLGHSVVILEKANRVGGRAYNFCYKNYTFEMGALLATPYYLNVFDLLKEVGFSTRPFFKDYPSVDSRIAFDPFANVSLTSTQIGQVAATPEYGAAVLRYLQLSYQYPELNTGYTLNPLPRGDLHLPMKDWLEKYGLQILAGFFASYTTAYGYGGLDYVPALYCLKYATMFDFLSYLNAQDVFLRVDQTFETLFGTLASTLQDVRLNVDITKVERKSSGRHRITIWYNDNNSVKCRRLIVASPKTLEKMPFMDFDQTETDIFGKVKLERYWSSVVDLTGKKPPLPEGSQPHLAGSGILNVATASQLNSPVNPILRGTGEVVAFATLRYKEGLPDVHTLYSWSREPKTLDEIRANIIPGVKNIFGADIADSDIKVVLEWDYSPHVGSEDVASGFHQKLEELQGYRRTYYTGALMTFDLVERVVAYSNGLVVKHFLKDF